jgi:hypothetical protein
MARVVADAAERDREFRKARTMELAFSSIAAAWAVLAVWGFTNATSVGGIASQTLGGLAVLCFSACMAIAAGGGIRKRFIALVTELDAQRGGVTHG